MFEETTMTNQISSFKKYASFIILFSLIISIGAVLWLVIIPIKQTIFEKAQGIQQFFAEEENQTKQVNRLPELKDQYTAITENESSLDILLTEGQIVDFIKTLEDLALETKVQMIIESKENGQITELKKAPTKIVVPSAKNQDPTEDTVNTKAKVTNIVDDAPFDRYLRLNIKIEGQYKNIVAFLRKMETLPVGLDVVGMELKRVDSTAEKNSSMTGRGSFSFVGSGIIAADVPSQITVQDLLNATFDVLVYVDK